MTTATQTFSSRQAQLTSNRMGRILLAGFALVAILLLGGLTYQGVATVLDQRNFPPPGSMVDAGGHKLHLHVMGEEHTAGPTVILEAGATSFSSQWAWIQPEIAKVARVVAYDRAGSGWSEPSGQAPEGDLVAQQLHSALTNLSIEGPYILVGHSFGGALVRVFAARYPDEVAGLVLLDPIGPEIHAELTPEEQSMAQGFADMTGVAAVLARFGVLRLYNPLAGSAAGLPERQMAEVQAFSVTPKHLLAAQGDLRQSQFPDSTTMAQIREAQLPSPDLPVVIVNRTEPADHVTEAHQMGGVAILSQTIEGKQILIDGADHFSLTMNPEHARVVVDAIEDLIETSH